MLRLLRSALRWFTGQSDVYITGKDLERVRALADDEQMIAEVDEGRRGKRTVLDGPARTGRYTQTVPK